MPRDWGQWTQIKLDTLEKYFSAFTLASSSATNTLYIDLFGGRPDNRSREDDEWFRSAAMRAAAAQPPFTQLIVSELNGRAAKEQRIQLEHLAPNRATVVAGDCNQVMLPAMRQLPKAFQWAPTFALIDQYSAEIRWRTLQQLANFKTPASRTKVEMCLFFGPQFLVRGLRGAQGKTNAQYAARLDAMFGCRDWRMILAAREDEMLSGEQCRDELLNLMRWRIERHLNYATTIPLQVVNTRGNGIFYLLFCTDHPVGAKIMTQLFEGAEDALHEMVQRAKERASLARAVARISADDQVLFGGEDLVTARPGQMLTRPTRPLLAPAEQPFSYHSYWSGDRPAAADAG